MERGVASNEHLDIDNQFSESNHSEQPKDEKKLPSELDSEQEEKDLDLLSQK